MNTATTIYNKKWVIGNWKMNPVSIDELYEISEALADGLRADMAWADKVAVAIAPTVAHLGFVDYILGVDDEEEGELPIWLAAQDVSVYANAGAFTGDVSAEQIAELADWVIIGHSERRQYYGEHNEILTKKMTNAHNAELGVVLCVGETKDDYEKGITLDVLNAQLAVLKGQSIAHLLIAYEPVWAIGTGLTPTTDEIKAVHAHIKSHIQAQFGIAPPVLYGGSVNDGNADELATLDGVDGVLVGGASLKADKFLAIVQAFAN